MSRIHRSTGLRLALATGLLALVAGCGIETFSLPSLEQTGTGGLSDTTYLMLNSWIDLGSEDANPSDVFINDDGHVYVAESGSGRISVWNQALRDLNEPGPGVPLGEPALEGFELPGVKGVTVGPEQLLFACDGGNKLWAVNLLAARENVVGAYTHFRLTHRQTGEVSEVDAAGVADLIQNNQFGRYEVVPTAAYGDSALAAALVPRVFWEGSGNTTIDAVSRGRAGQREVFFVNNNPSGGNRINRLRFRPEALVLLADDYSAFTYFYRPFVAADSMDFPNPAIVINQGTGQGTIEGGTSLDLDDQARLYYTQLAPSIGYFRAQRLTWEEFAGEDYWSFDASLGNTDIMNPELFGTPSDITWSRDRIFVCDTDNRRVQVFDHSGRFQRPCGASRVYIDTTLVFNDVPVDTVLKSWNYDQLRAPVGVAVFGNRSDRDRNSEETIFVSDDGGVVSGSGANEVRVNDRILLFTLSLSQDDLPPQ
ncbi:MAG: hypothetical protein KDC10_05450 [Calditrichaeota bacterium]|nr:hypothetical protein [Candidatus Cloacimonadota bacterium]MCB1046628.1 hypothetical protein [Calditrichota bacterium]